MEDLGQAPNPRGLRCDGKKEGQEEGVRSHMIQLCTQDRKAKHTVTLRNKQIIPRKSRTLSGKGPTERNGQVLGGSHEPVLLGSSVQLFLEAPL